MEKRNRGYYSEFIKETRRIIREQDQSAGASDIVREIESHRAGLEEKEERDMRTNPVGDMVHDALTEAIEGVPIEELEDMDPFSMEDKIIMSREEDYPHTRELTPGEISRIVNNALRDLPASLREENGPALSDVCFNVAYAVMARLGVDPQDDDFEF